MIDSMDPAPVSSVPPASVPSMSVRLSRGARVVVGLGLVVVLIGIVVRLVGLSRQGYWSDEQFSVDEASYSLSHLWDQGSVEIHPPLFALVTWVWEHAGGSFRPRWMRLFPALCGCAAVVMSWWGLRRSGLSVEQRVLCMAGTAASGMAIIYSQDFRSYSLLLLASVGATATTVVLGAGRSTSFRWRVWCGWCMLASATHLFGAILTVWLGACLCLLMPKRRRTVVLTLVALIPQFIWLGHGVFTRGFAKGTDWIPAPRLHDVTDLVSTVFGIGNLRMDPGGFTMRNPAVVIAMVGLVVAAGVAGMLQSSEPEHSMDGSPHGQSPTAQEVPVTVARLLVLVSVGLPMAVFLGSQLVHLWTLRNMVIVLPAWVWSVCLLVSGLPRSAVVRHVLSVGLLVALLGGMLGTTVAKQHRYKTDTGRSMDALAMIRTKNPQAQLYVDGIGRSWLFSSHQPVTDAEFRRLIRPRRIISIDKLDSITPATGPTIYLFRANWGTNSQDADHEILAKAGSGCRTIPLAGVAMVTCHIH